MRRNAEGDVTTTVERVDRVSDRRCVGALPDRPLLGFGLCLLLVLASRAVDLHEDSSSRSAAGRRRGCCADEVRTLRYPLRGRTAVSSMARARIATCLTPPC